MWRLYGRRVLIASHERFVASLPCGQEARNVEPGHPDHHAGLKIHGLWRLRTSNEGLVLETLRGIELQAYDGSVTAIVGPRHAGKSSLVSVLLGLEEPNAGTISVYSNVRYSCLSDLPSGAHE